MEFYFGWIILSVVVGVYANSKGHSFGWMLLFAVIFSPLVAGLVEMVRTPNVERVEAKAVTSGDRKKCPSCAELVKSEAIKCRFCGTDFPALE